MIDLIFLPKAVFRGKTPAPYPPPLSPRVDEYLFFPTGTPWQIRVQTLALWALAIAAVGGFLLFTEAGRSLLEASPGEVLIVAAVICVLLWIRIIARRPAAWRRSLENNPDRRAPPLVWRVLLDLTHFAYVALFLAFIWWGFAGFFLGLGISKWQQFLFMVSGLAWPGAYAPLRRWLVRRYGWALPEHI